MFIVFLPYTWLRIAQMESVRHSVLLEQMVKLPLTKCVQCGRYLMPGVTYQSFQVAGFQLFASESLLNRRELQDRT